MASVFSCIYRFTGGSFGVLITWLDSFYLDLALGMLRVVPQLQMFLRQKV